MADVPFRLPTRDEEARLHERLIAGDPVATADLAEAYLEPLISWLGKRNSRRIPSDVIQQAAEDAILSLIRNPKSFDATRSTGRLPLFALLKLSAQGDLMNALDSERRARRGRRTLESVEQSSRWRKHVESEAGGNRIELKEEAARAERKVIAPARLGLAPAEACCLELVLAGEKRTAAFVEALGIQDRPWKEQQAIVKRLKDKLNKRIERANHDRIP
jgi:hypothetical protein